MNLLSVLGLTATKPRSVFVVGCGHSGTSLTAIMLGAHPQIHSIAIETEAFLGKLTNHEARAVIEAAAADRNKHARMICEKTPRHVHHVGRIAETFNGARFVVCLRDPRDVACSIKRRTGKLQDGIKRWKEDNEAVVALRERQDCLLLRYEDLIAAPEPVLRRLCAFLGLGYRRRMLEFWRDDRDWFGSTARHDTDGRGRQNHVIRRNWQIHQPLMKDRVGVWRQEFTDEEIRAVSDQLGPLAAQLGYSLD